MINEQISVIMGIYNCADTLSDAIDSILAQTYTNWQLILCDDCSTDKTYDIAKSYQERFPDKIILIQNETNRLIPLTTVLNMQQENMLPVWTAMIFRCPKDLKNKSNF